MRVRVLKSAVAGCVLAILCYLTFIPVAVGGDDEVRSHLERLKKRVERLERKIQELETSLEQRDGEEQAVIAWNRTEASWQVAGTSGVLQQSWDQFDLAIRRDGFFQIVLPNGEFRYTRDGSFRLNEVGQLVTRHGYGFQIQPAITIPNNAISVGIRPDGRVTVTTPGSSTATAVGQILLSRFDNPAGLRRDVRGLLKETLASGPPQIGPPGQDGRGTLQQGCLEKSKDQIGS